MSNIKQKLELQKPISQKLKIGIIISIIFGMLVLISIAIYYAFFNKTSATNDSSKSAIISSTSPVPYTSPTSPAPNAPIKYTISCNYNNITYYLASTAYGDITSLFDPNDPYAQWTGVDIQNVGNGKYLYSIDLKLKLIPSVIQDIVKFKWLPDADDYTTGKSISEIIIDLRHEFLCKIYNTADFLYLDLDTNTDKFILTDYIDPSNPPISFIVSPILYTSSTSPAPNTSSYTSSTSPTSSPTSTPTSSPTSSPTSTLTSSPTSTPTSSPTSTSRLIFEHPTSIYSYHDPTTIIGTIQQNMPVTSISFSLKPNYVSCNKPTIEIQIYRPTASSVSKIIYSYVIKPYENSASINNLNFQVQPGDQVLLLLQIDRSSPLGCYIYVNNVLITLSQFTITPTPISQLTIEGEWKSSENISRYFSISYTGSSHKSINVLNNFNDSFILPIDIPTNSFRGKTQLSPPIYSILKYNSDDTISCSDYSDLAYTIPQTPLTLLRRTESQMQYYKSTPDLLISTNNGFTYNLININTTGTLVYVSIVANIASASINAKFQALIYGNDYDLDGNCTDCLGLGPYAVDIPCGTYGPLIFKSDTIKGPNTNAYEYNPLPVSVKSGQIFAILLNADSLTFSNFSVTLRIIPTPLTTTTTATPAPTVPGCPVNPQNTYTDYGGVFYQCNDGYYFKNPNDIQYWGCGADCPGGAYFTDSGCNCNCIPYPANCPPIPN